MTLLILGLILFLGVHSTRIVADGWRSRVIARAGEGVWKGSYALVAAAGLALIVYGYAAARQAPLILYTPPAGMRHLALLLMLPVFPLLLATYLPGRLAAAARHPMLLATKLWALAHLLANGSAADVLLFGGFLAWAVLDRIALKRRGAPSAAVPSTGAMRNDALALVGGLALYGAFIAGLHRWLIGVSPL